MRSFVLVVAFDCARLIAVYLTRTWGSFRVPKSNLSSSLYIRGPPLSRFGFSTDDPFRLVRLPRKSLLVALVVQRLSLSGTHPDLLSAGSTP